MLLSSSKRLAARAAAGDERAFTQIFERHHQELYRYCLGILRRPADAEDALQSTMSKALQSLPGEEREIELRPWLFRVAHNEAITILRGRSGGATTELVEESPGPEHRGPAAQAEMSERMRELVADLGSLPDRQRGALVMRELSGLGYAEIASAFDCGEGAARQTVYEARAALQVREEGRAMLCDDVRRALSDGDRRRLRGRRIRAHLDGCEGCSDFQAAIEFRREDLAALCPPLPAAAAAGLIGGLLSSGAAGSGAGLGAGAVGAGAGSIASGVGSAAAIKGASVVAAIVIAAGGADAVGVIDLPSPLRGSGNHSESAAPAGASDAGAHSATAGHAGPAASAGHGSTAGAAEGAGGAHRGGHHGSGNGQTKSGGHHGEGQGGVSGEAGNSGKTPPGQSAGGSDSTGNGSSGSTGPPDNSNAGGNANGVPGGGYSTAPGQTSTAPGQSKAPGTSAGNGTPAGGSGSSNAGGNSSTSSAGSSGNSSTAPGQTGVPPLNSNAGGNGKKPVDIP